MAKGSGGGGGPVGGGRVPPSAAFGTPAQRGSAAAALDDKIRALEKELSDINRKMPRRVGPKTNFESLEALRDRKATLEAKLKPLLHQRLVERNY